MRKHIPLVLLSLGLLLSACSSDPAQPKQPKPPRQPAQPEQPVAPEQPKKPAPPKPPPKRVVENWLGMKFAWVPASDFVRGSDVTPVDPV